MFVVSQPFFIFSNFCHLLVIRTNIWSCQFCFCLVTSNCLWRPCSTVDYRKPSGTQITGQSNSGGKGWPWGIPVTFHKSAVILSLCSSVRDVLLVQWLRCGCACRRAAGWFNVHWFNWCIEWHLALQLKVGIWIIGFSNGQPLYYILILWKGSLSPVRGASGNILQPC